ncbi:MAG: outer membrane protein [Candidatus Spyradosoma sp.]
MIKTSKNMLLAATVAAASIVPAVGAFAQDADFAPAPAASPWAVSLGAEAFYGTPTKNVFKDDSDFDKIDIGGVNLRCTLKNADLELAPGLTPEFFGIVGVGSGSEEVKTYGYGVLEDDDKISVVEAQLAVGANLRWQATEHFSVFAGVRVGLGYLWVEGEDKILNEKHDESDVGFLYGAGVGAEWAFNAHHAVTVGYDFVGSTARPKVGSSDEKEKVEAQNYHMFSIGYKYTF